MQYRDYYEILGVDRKAGQDEIKKIYRKLARKYHPDVSKEKNAESRFKEIGEAYEVLRDKEKRASYDRLGANWKQGQDFTPPPGWGGGFSQAGGFSSNRDGASFSDFFESMFGQATSSHTGADGFSRASQQTRGQDQLAKIEIDIEDSIKGASKNITLKIPQKSGQQIIINERVLKIKVPKGIKSGQKIRLSGQGAEGVGGGPNGDLQLEVSFRKHPLYRVEEADIYLDLPVTPWEAALGADIDIPTPDGRITIKVPPDSVQGKKLRLKGRGIPGKQVGDFFVVINLTLPKGASTNAHELYRKMQDELTYNPRLALS